MDTRTEMLGQDGVTKASIIITDDVFNRWRKLGTVMGFVSDTDIARFLLERHESTGFRQAHCVQCHAPLSLLCARCQLTCQSQMCQLQEDAGRSKGLPGDASSPGVSHLSAKSNVPENDGVRPTSQCVQPFIVSVDVKLEPEDQHDVRLTCASSGQTVSSMTYTTSGQTVSSMTYTTSGQTVSSMTYTTSGQPVSSMTCMTSGRSVSSMAYTLSQEFGISKSTSSVYNVQALCHKQESIELNSQRFPNLLTSSNENHESGPHNGITAKSITSGCGLRTFSHEQESLELRVPNCLTPSRETPQNTSGDEMRGKGSRENGGIGETCRVALQNTKPSHKCEQSSLNSSSSENQTTHVLKKTTVGKKTATKSLANESVDKKPGDTCGRAELDCDTRSTDSGEMGGHHEQNVRTDETDTGSNKPDAAVTKPTKSAQLPRRELLQVTQKRKRGQPRKSEAGYRCIYCSSEFARNSDFKKHVQSHTVTNHSPSKLHMCKECGNCFKSNTVLKVHMRTHTGERPFVCEICGSAFKQKSNLNNHMTRHSGEKPFVCQDCGAAFSRREVLKTHRRIHTGDRPYTCTECNASFAQISALKNHQLIHTDSKPWMCKECGRSFKQQSSLMSHLRTHVSDRPFACKQCDATFKNSSYLKIHMRSHTGDRPYICDYCGYRFTTSSALVVHKRSHTGDKPYVCCECGAAFSCSSSKKRHMLRHTGERHFVCTECGFAFSRSSHLNIHVKRKHSQYVGKTGSCRRQQVASATVHVDTTCSIHTDKE